MDLSEKHLSEKLKDWTDFDVAQFYVGQKLGIFENEWKPEYKGILWSANPVSETLTKILIGLVEIDFLEQNEDLQFRWDSTTTVLESSSKNDV